MSYKTISLWKNKQLDEQMNGKMSKGYLAKIKLPPRKLVGLIVLCLYFFLNIWCFIICPLKPSKLLPTSQKGIRAWPISSSKLKISPGDLFEHLFIIDRIYSWGLANRTFYFNKCLPRPQKQPPKPCTYRLSNLTFYMKTIDPGLKHNDFKNIYQDLYEPW